MAQNITLLGASYSAVPAVTLPKTGGGTARYDDASVTTATASDVASGKIFLASDGTITTGTSSGGGDSDFVVTLSYNNSSDMWEPDKTFAEILAAHNTGKTIGVYAYDENLGSEIPASGSLGTTEFYYSIYQPSQDGYTTTALAYYIDANGVEYNDEWNVYQTDGASATPADVVSGKTFFNGGGLQTGTASGGGSSSWELIKQTSLQVSTTSTSAAAAGTVQLGLTAYTSDCIIWVHIRGQSGKRAGYFYGSDTFFVNPYPANGSTTTFSAPAVEYSRVTTSGTYAVGTGSYGVYGYSISGSGGLIIRRRYNSNYTLTIDDTFDIYVYKLSLPSGLTLFE